jgi:hypothetical protein
LNVFAAGTGRRVFYLSNSWAFHPNGEPAFRIAGGYLYPAAGGPAEHYFDSTETLSEAGRPLHPDLLEGTLQPPPTEPSVDSQPLPLLLSGRHFAFINIATHGLPRWQRQQVFQDIATTLGNAPEPREGDIQDAIDAVLAKQAQDRQ